MPERQWDPRYWTTTIWNYGCGPLAARASGEFVVIGRWLRPSEPNELGCASRGSRSCCPSAQRYSMVMLVPLDVAQLTQAHARNTAGTSRPKDRTSDSSRTGNCKLGRILPAAQRARGESGHAAAAPRKRDKLSPSHLITSSARSEQRRAGRSRPSDLAVLRLMIISNFVGAPGPEARPHSRP